MKSERRRTAAVEVPGRFGTALSVGLAERIWEACRADRISPGQRLPTVRDLVRKYRVSVNVAQGAVRRLAGEGLIDARRGRGSVLRVDPNERSGPRVRSWAEVLDLPVSGSAYFRRYAREITRAGHRVGFHFYLYDSFLHGSRAAEIRTLQDARSGKFDAVVLFNVRVGRHLKSLLKSVRRKGIPVIFLERLPKGLNGRWDVVGPDDVAGGQLIGRRLVAMGHRRVVHLGHRRLPEDASGRRLTGLRTALAEAGVRLDDADCWEVGLPATWFQTDSLGQLQRWLQARRPTAVTLFTDAYMTFLSPMLERLMWRVGSDISVVGYDASPEDAGRPDLASVDPRHDEIGRRVVEVLQKRVGGDQSGPYECLIAPEFVEGTTLGKAPVFGKTAGPRIKP